MAYKPDKHGRDHCPGGEDPIPCLGGAGLGKPHIIMDGGIATIPSGGITFPVPFSSLWYDPTRVTKGDVFDWSITDTGDSGNDRFVLTTYIEGWYAFDLVTAFDQVTTGGTNEFAHATQRLTFEQTGYFNWAEADFRASADWNDADLHPFFEMVDNSQIHDFRIMHLPANCGDWVVTAGQRTGVNRGLSGVLKAWFIEAEDASVVWDVEFV